MQHYSNAKEALLPLMNRLYEEIRELEIAHELWAGPEDYRPRIERFHDAVRAFTSGASPYDPNTRLSVEALAEDMERLRAIQANPLYKMPRSQHGSPSNALMVQKPGAVGNTRSSARAVRSQLSGRYQNYAVMFSALLAEAADMNHQARMEEQDANVEELAQLHYQVAGKKRVNLQAEAQAILDDLGIVQQLPRGEITGDQASDAIKNAQAQADRVQEGLESAHMTWLSGQLQLYQEGKEVVQGLMQNGLQMAGKFLQDSMQKGGMGGRGM